MKRLSLLVLLSLSIAGCGSPRMAGGVAPPMVMGVSEFPATGGVLTGVQVEPESVASVKFYAGPVGDVTLRFTWTPGAGESEHVVLCIDNPAAQSSWKMKAEVVFEPGSGCPSGTYRKKCLVLLDGVRRTTALELKAQPLQK